MIPYRSVISLNKLASVPVYLQLANQLVDLIKRGVLAPKSPLPSSRKLAELLQIHRKTVLASYEELLLQGWIKTIPKKGTFVNVEVPIVQQADFGNSKENSNTQKASFSFYENKNTHSASPRLVDGHIYLNDGVSDPRLTPVNDLAIYYRSIAAKKSVFDHLGYTSMHGHLELRQTLVDYLNQTRGLKLTISNIMITRGSQMGIYLAAKLLLRTDDCIVVGTTNYSTADLTFEHQGARLIRVPVDEHGLNTEYLEKLCQQRTIKAVYVTPHHHHPTTVTLSAERRLHLLDLAQKHQFAILEDDYDYDFNYNHAPILPLKSHDVNGNVLYIGSICKTVAPVFRIGYLIGPTEVIDEAARLRRYMDRQGDALLELTFSKFIKNGDLDRHINKVLKIYKERRDFFCKTLQEELGDYFSFMIPKGGMAVWVTLHKKYDWATVSKIALEKKLVISDWKRYDSTGEGHNAIRMGFATYTLDEISELIQKLKITMREIAKNDF